MHRKMPEAAEQRLWCLSNAELMNKAKLFRIKKKDRREEIFMRQKGIQDSCTTILVGKKASYDGSTIVARTEDSQNGVFTPKKFVVVEPQDQPRHYQSVLTSFEMDLPDNPVRYTAVPDAVPKDGIW